MLDNILETELGHDKIDQLSQTFRYVEVNKDDKERPSEIRIRETFLGFHHSKSQMAADMTDQITEIIESKVLSFDQCRRQGYNGASTMSGAYGEVRKFIQDKQPIHVHCAGHNLNLVVNDAVTSC